MHLFVFKILVITTLKDNLYFISAQRKGTAAAAAAAAAASAEAAAAN